MLRVFIMACVNIDALHSWTCKFCWPILVTSRVHFRFFLLTSVYSVLSLFEVIRHTVDVEILAQINYEPPPPLGWWGPSRFTVVSRHPNVFLRSHLHLCQTLFMQYFLQFSANCFQILRYDDHGKDLELINFSWPWCNFQGHRESLCFKIKFVFVIFPVVLCW